MHCGHYFSGGHEPQADTCRKADRESRAGLFSEICRQRQLPGLLELALPLDRIAKSDYAGAVRYPGGKGSCYQHIINVLPPHRVYIEAHLGGGAVLLRKKPSAVSFGIDRDPFVIRWWRDNHPELATYFNSDALDFLGAYPFHGDELVYCDPPYLPSTRRRIPAYRFEYSELDHVRLLEGLRTVPCRVVLSGYPSDLYNEALQGWTSIKFSARTQTGVREEMLWFNFPHPRLLHDARYLGTNFRERQTIKRRVARLRRRIERLSPTEQSVLFSSFRHSWDEPCLSQGGGSNDREVSVSGQDARARTGERTGKFDQQVAEQLSLFSHSRPSQGSNTNSYLPSRKGPYQASATSSSAARLYAYGK